MSPKKQLIKYSLFIVVYITICLSLLVFRINHGHPEKFVTRNASYLGKLRPTMPEVISIDVQQSVDSTLQRISAICEKYNKTSSLERKHFFYSPKHSALFCWIRKVASTSFTQLFADLRGIAVQRNYYKESGSLSPTSVEEFLNLIDDTGVFKFIAVRDPFERLVSTYRSRIEDNEKFSDQAWLYAPRIFYTTRPELFHFNETIGNPLQQIFDNNRRLKLIPKFREFITWLLKQPEESDDDHWSQYHSHCSICQMNFDFIFKIDYDTAEFIHEIDYVFKKLNSTLDKWDFLKLGQTRGGKTNFQQTCKYLSTLPKYMFEKLYERYRIDFEMFDYDFSRYTSCRKY